MAKRTTDRQRLALKLDRLSDTEVNEVINYISSMESTQRSAASPSVSEDDLISLLADTKENLRARQVFEWESARRRAERRAAINYSARV